MSASKLDAVYRSILITRFFTKGWGKPENLRRLFEFKKVVSNRDECLKLIERDYPVTITKEQNLSDCRVLDGYFITPLERYLPGIVPEVAQKAHFQIVLPLKWPDPNCKPMCLHLAGTGDHFFWRRRNLMVRPLLKEAGIGGIILENPFYGLRKPTDQVRSSLHNVSDIFVMGGCLMLESLVLFHWCERNGLGPLGVTGLSMGGHMASLAATNWPKPLVLVPCLSWSTASAVFLQGVMSQSINWDLLEDQYLSDGIYREKLSKMVTVVDEAFLAGKKFAQNMSTDRQNVNKTTNNPNVDITYKEIDNKNREAEKEKTKCVDVNNDNFDNFDEELKVLLSQDKISVSLFEKLTGNVIFQLEAKDIEELNSISEDRIIAKVARKFKIDNIKGSNNKLVKEDKVLKDNTNTHLNKVKESIKSNNGDKKKSWNVADLTSDIWTKVPFIGAKPEKKIDINKIHWRDREALQFMRGVMDECTHLSNFSNPFDTSLIIAVCAEYDAYVPRSDVGRLEEIWPGAEVRYVDAGHVAAYILHQSIFRSCIKEAFDRSRSRWKDGRHID